jgi:hypothetical protein
VGHIKITFINAPIGSGLTITSRNNTWSRLSRPQFNSGLIFTKENTGNSYNIRSMAENIDRTFKKDNAWFSDFTNQFNSSTSSGLAVSDAMNAARAFADNGRYIPHSSQMNRLIDSLRDINNWDYGAALRVKANLMHSEFQHDLGNVLFGNSARASLMYGLDFRDYIYKPDGGRKEPELLESWRIYSSIDQFIEG